MQNGVKVPAMAGTETLLALAKVRALYKSFDRATRELALAPALRHAATADCDDND